MDCERLCSQLTTREIRWLCFRYGFPRHVAEDLVQTAWMKILRRGVPLDLPRLGGLLRKTVQNLATDYLRSQHRHPEVSFEQVSLVVKPAFAGSCLIRETFARLGPSAREVFERRAAGDSLGAIAQDTGWNVRQVVNLLYAARRKARKLVEQPPCPRVRRQASRPAAFCPRAA